LGTGKRVLGIGRLAHFGKKAKGNGKKPTANRGEGRVIYVRNTCIAWGREPHKEKRTHSPTVGLEEAEDGQELKKHLVEEERGSVNAEGLF